MPGNIFTGHLFGTTTPTGIKKVQTPKAETQAAAVKLTERAEVCFENADAQHKNADLQQESAKLQHANAEKLVVLGTALETDAAKLETQVGESPAAHKVPSAAVPAKDLAD